MQWCQRERAALLRSFALPSWLPWAASAARVPPPRPTHLPPPCSRDMTRPAASPPPAHAGGEQEGQEEAPPQGQEEGAEGQAHCRGRRSEEGEHRRRHSDGERQVGTEAGGATQRQGGRRAGGPTAWPMRAQGGETCWAGYQQGGRAAGSDRGRQREGVYLKVAVHGLACALPHRPEVVLLAVHAVSNQKGATQSKSSDGFGKAAPQ